MGGYRVDPKILETRTAVVAGNECILVFARTHELEFLRLVKVRVSSDSHSSPSSSSS